MKILGIILIAIGLVDLLGSYAEFDLWGGFFGVHLPDIVWKFSAYIAIGAGYFALQFSSSSDETDLEAEESKL